MSQQRFSPGPWHVIDRGTTVMADCACSIADVLPCCTGARNAHLIAAAPQLYAVCESAEALLSLLRVANKRSTLNGAISAEIEKLNAAITAARGETP